MKHLVITLLSLLLCNTFWSQCGTTGETILVENSADLALLEGCDTIWGSLTIHDWDASDLDELSSLAYVEENLVLNENIALLNVDGLQNLTEVGGNLELKSNFTLQYITGLESLAHIGGNLLIEGNITLVNMDGLELLTDIQGDFVLSENHTLQDLNGLENLSMINGDFTIDHENVILNDLLGLSSLMSVGGNFYCSLPDATTIDGLESLASVGGSLTLENLENLSNINGLQGLLNVGSDLQIRTNDNLVDVNALQELEEVGGNLEIHDNGALFLCCGLKPVVQNDVVGGNITIENNGTGCNSQNEIIDLCEDVSIADQQLDYFFIARKNGFALRSDRIIEARIFDILGGQVAVLEAGYNVSFTDTELSNGIYLIQLKSGLLTETRKYLKD